jgi:hypothetical protein
MSKLRERLEEATGSGFTKNPAQFNKITRLADNLNKQLKAITNLSFADDEIWLITSKRYELIFDSLIKSMKEKGKVRRA